MTDTLKWHRFDYEDKSSTVPPQDLHYEPVWIVEDYYTEGVTLGYYDGNSFRTFGGSDDCSVSWWAKIRYPEPPADWKPGGEEDGDS